MAKQFLGEKKQKICEDIANMKYKHCLVRGGREHFLAECWHTEGANADWVNYKTREVEPYIRNGEIVRKQNAPNQTINSL